MSQIAFTKLQALGNDFVLIDARLSAVNLSLSQRQRLGNRRLGIGYDQLLLLQAGKSADSLCSVVIFNQDGSRAEQCGNGMRAVGRWLQIQGELIDHGWIDSDAGRIELCLDGEENLSTSLPGPSFDPAAAGFDGAARWQEPFEGRQLDFAVVSMGNPHLVIIDPKGPSAEALAAHGRRFSPPGAFRQGSNVNLACAHDRQHIELQVYERGVGPTQACGSGACATAALMIAEGLVDSPVCVSQPGGSLVIDWQPNARWIRVQGPASRVFDGQFDLLETHQDHD